ncbi:DEP domain-containing protein [Anthocerotibacter panamensis]|uniref:DEP domain-containing protein n=1 Tax=Anthocerotibacter panamensis TaxID=2857077 RepID=UPI001C405106|nr:DEP domain-containing protein [Anthocerotibacter panamensis]
MFIFQMEELPLQGNAYGKTLEISLYNQVFVREQTYAKEQRAQVLNLCRERLDNNQICFVVEEDQGLTLWSQGGKTEPLARFLTNQSIQQIHRGLDVRDRRWRLKLYPRCFVGSDAVLWFMQNFNLTREEALDLGQRLMDRRIFHHVLDSQPFQDGYFFYRFYQDES